MALIPQYKQQVAAQGGNTTKAVGGATANQFGLAKAQDLQNLGTIGQEATGAYLTYQKRMDQKLDRATSRQKLNDASLEMRKAHIRLKTKKGQAGSTSYKGFDAELGKIQEKYIKGLDNENQKNLFRDSFDAKANSYRENALEYQDQQLRIFDQKTKEAENLNVLEEAVASGMPKAAPGTAEFEASSMGVALKKIQQNIESSNGVFLNDKGQKVWNLSVGKEIVEKKVEDAHFKVWEAMNKDLSAKSPTAALENLKENWKHFDPKDRQFRKEQLEESSLREWSSNRADEISTSGKDLEGQLKEAGKIKDPDRRRLVKAGVKEQFAEKEMFKEMKYKARIEDEVDALYRSPHNYDVPFEVIRGKDQVYLTKLKKYLMEEDQGNSIKTDFKLYGELMAMPEDEFMKVDLKQYLIDGKLNPKAEYKELVKLQRKGKSFTTTNPYSLLKTAVRGIEDFSKDGGEEANKRLNDLTSAFGERIRLVPEKERTEEKSIEIIKSLMEPVTVDSGIWFGLGDRPQYRFETLNIEDDKTREERFLDEKNIPEDLKAFGNDLKFSATTDQYYVEGDGIIRVYDLDGILIETYSK